MASQVTAYLPAAEEEAFRRYARSLGLDKSSLAKLLLVRETRLGRLTSLANHRHRTPLAACVKVTAHAVDETVKDALMRSAERLRVGLGVAASIVIRAELHERWLERSMSWIDSDRVAD